MAVNSTNLDFLQSETVVKKLPDWFASYKLAFNLIEKMEPIKANERDVRIPYKASTGGAVGTYNPNGGSYRRGTRMQGGKLISTFWPWNSSFELTELDEFGTDVNSIKNAMTDAVTNGVKEFTIFVDKLFHGSGNAVLATATATTTTSGNTVYTLDTSFGAMLLRRGTKVMVYDSALTTIRSGGPYLVNTLDIINRKVTLNGTVPSAASTDKLLLEGVTGSSPVGPKGLQYFNDYSGTSTILGTAQTAEPELIANGVDGSGGINHLLLLRLYHMSLKRRGEVSRKTVGLISPSTVNAIYQQIMNVQRYDIDKGNKAKDLLPGIDDTISLAGIPHMVDIHQDQSRIDQIVPGNWMKVEMKPMGPVKDKNGNSYWKLFGGDGAPAAGTWFGFQWLADFACCDMGSEGVCYGIPVVSGY